MEGGEPVDLSQLRVHVCTAAAELRAAAAVRAASFYSYPPDRSEFATRAHARMKTDHEWRVLEAKVAGDDELWAVRTHRHP